MPSLRRVPPGRAGRLWLQRRLAVARRGADLLDQKVRILLAEQQRLALLVARTSSEWDATAREADTWLLRGALVSGQRGVRLAGDGAAADVEVTWATSMGVRYPAEAVCAFPEPDQDALPAGSSALDAAKDAYRHAVDAAVQHAVAEAAVREVQAELVATRRRFRAVEDRWLPRLERALGDVRLGLEEQEHAEGVRLRWVVGRRPGEDGAT